MDFKSFEKSIKRIETAIGYTFTDKSLLRQAFTRTTFCNEHRGKGKPKYESNEVLENFGDSVLSAAIVTLFMRDFTKRYENGIQSELTEGDFSNIKSKLSDKTNLSSSIKKMGLQKFLITGNGEREKEIEEPSVAEDLFESLIGAIYIDSENSMKSVIKSVEKMLDFKEYLTSKAPPIQSHKNELQEFCADKRRRLPAPVYKTLSESGPDHNKVYERGCYIGDKLVGRGTGKNQKLADSAAAKNALDRLKADECKQKIAKSNNTPSPVQKLRDFTAQNKKVSPEYRDLGETTENGSSVTEYKVECRAMGVCAIGIAQSKREAKEKAATALLKQLKTK